MVVLCQKAETYTNVTISICVLRKPIMPGLPFCVLMELSALELPNPLLTLGNRLLCLNEDKL